MRLIVMCALVSLTGAMPLAKTMVDLTYVYDETTPTHPMFKRFQIDSLINGTYKEFAWLQFEEFSITAHAGTHMDAPAHFTMGGRTVDQIPVSEFIAPAAVIDIVARAEVDQNAEVTLDDLLQWEEGTGQSLNGTVVMINSGWGKKWQDRAAFSGVDNDGNILGFPGISPEACRWLVDNRSIKGIGTHMDAPAHFIAGGLTLDQIPVSEFIAPAAVIDIASRAETDPNAEVTLDDLLQWEEGTGQSLNGTMVMINSGWGKKWQDRSAFNGENDGNLIFPGIAPEACQWLVDNRSIKGIGTDTLSIDRGSTTDNMSHIITLGHGLYILENVANLDKLPAYGAKLYIFPMKIGRGSGAPTRIVASIPKIIYRLPISNLL